MELLKKIFIHSLGHYIAALILAVGMGLFRVITLPEGVGVRFAWYEILSVSGAVVFLIGALMTVSYLGAFELFGYVFSPERRGKRRKYKNYAQYSQQMAEKRAKGEYYFVPYYVIGAFVFVLSFLFR